MKHVYKTKSIEERIDILNALISKHQLGSLDRGRLLLDIDTEDDWKLFPYVIFYAGDNDTTINLGCSLGGGIAHDTVGEFLSVCGIVKNVSYKGLTIPKHRFV